MILSLLIFFTSILISKLSQLQQEIATVYQLSERYDVIHHREVLPSAQSPSLALHAISSVIKSMAATKEKSHAKLRYGGRERPHSSRSVREPSSPVAVDTSKCPRE